ncbi:MBL fold metallo-hydrolase [Mycolicibacterium sp. CBMA 226]|uniref:MBL fold metallo-hydrolase n=1 Tax=Mycolicibacterium sp. CBMA 226 TaxID=2606611 RepID=UPI00130CBE68|nr:MBL fold metallo-hydrolase [Mycolicibacterium sp. CBMA 226]MUL79056.1 MBL fold metallo-hydrolase [Mycolicibacterium sp. CBMA 226]QGW61380.1 Hydroxyacylglutathione hydrolase GloC [Mycolicibacterium sp.]
MSAPSLIAEKAGLRVERVVTSGTFSLDGGTWEVDNNVWLIGTAEEVIVVDAAHDADAIVGAVAGRVVTAVICTHGHNDHINVATDLGDALSAPVLLHPGDAMLWRDVHEDRPFMALDESQRIGFAGTHVSVIHTPGHSPGSVCLYLPEADALFSGDTLFEGGPGATGRSFSDFPTIVGSIREKVLKLPAATRVFTGHGQSTSVGQEAPHLEEWIVRGH